MSLWARCRPLTWRTPRLSRSIPSIMEFLAVVSPYPRRSLVTFQVRSNSMTRTRPSPTCRCSNVHDLQLRRFHPPLELGLEFDVLTVNRDLVGRPRNVTHLIHAISQFCIREHPSLPCMQPSVCPWVDMIPSSHFSWPATS